jgi:hypothetical protein
MNSEVLEDEIAKRFLKQIMAKMSQKLLESSLTKARL